MAIVLRNLVIVDLIKASHAYAIRDMPWWYTGYDLMTSNIMVAS